AWKHHLSKKFILRGTLCRRPITHDSRIVSFSLAQLLKLDHQTSQWASAAVLCGNAENVERPPAKLRLTYEAVRHWKERRARGKTWMLRKDETIGRQAETFLALYSGKEVAFEPKHSEDYCFARAFSWTTSEEGKRRWPSLAGHESDRIEEMEKALLCASQGQHVSSKDHRVIQAVAMRSAYERKETVFDHPRVVNKSWPQFWGFLKFVLKK
ncbi:MAG: hypothetical protein HY460_02445, partial [Parcubacteria group bacterium]|nr:hypothetical protein [Parcubacteria group bacterium]